MHSLEPCLHTIEALLSALHREVQPNVDTFFDASNHSIGVVENLSRRRPPDRTFSLEALVTDRHEVKVLDRSAVFRLAHAFGPHA